MIYHVPTYGKTNVCISGRVSGQSVGGQEITTISVPELISQMSAGGVESVAKQCFQHGAVAVILGTLCYGCAIQSHAALTKQRMQEIVGYTRMVGGNQSLPISRHQLSRHKNMNVRINIKVAICAFESDHVPLDLLQPPQYPNIHIRCQFGSSFDHRYHIRCPAVGCKKFGPWLTQHNT
jgi:hypothetical protein